MSKKPLVIFGSGDIAQLAHYYFSRDSDYEVVAFTVDAAYVQGDSFCDLPVVAFEQLAERLSSREPHGLCGAELFETEFHPQRKVSFGKAGGISTGKLHQYPCHATERRHDRRELLYS